MKEKIIDWFLDRQLKLQSILGLICFIFLFLFGIPVLGAAFLMLLSLALIFAGQKLFPAETTENWIKFSYFNLVRSALGGALMLIGWGFFLRGVLSLTIAAIISKIS